MSKHYEQRKAANARWAAKQERFCMYLDPSDKAEIAAYAKAKGESMTAFLLRCAKQEMERDPLPSDDIDLEDPFDDLADSAAQEGIKAVRYERYATAEQITTRK